jgi:hypothetical protein
MTHLDEEMGARNMKLGGLIVKRDWCRAGLIMVLSVALAWAPGLRAEDLAKQADSLRLVPADAAFYDACLHLGDLCKSVAESKAWSKLKAMPIVKEGLRRAKESAKENPQLEQALKIYR